MKLCNLARLMIVFIVMGLAAQVQAAQVYLRVSAPYSNDNPSWHVWAWPNGQQGHDVAGTTLSNGLIEFTVNDADNNFQFVRKSSDGNSEWNRSVSLGIVADATYEITGWGDGSGMTADVTNPTYNTVYLDPSAVTEDGNVWYAWSYASGGNGSWVAGTLSGDEYAFNVASLKDQIIFVRMNANGAPSWDGAVMLNQTEDLGVQVDGTYVISSLGSNKMVGYWRSVDTSTGKPVWHQNASQDPDYYLSNRTALVGRHCMINELVSVVGVGSWISNLNNLVDEDLTNYATFPSIADVGVGVNPVTSVRDTKNHYAAGTTAGYSLVMASDASLLDLNVANCFAISFYLEGELQQTVAVDNGQSFGGVGLSLITLPGSTDVCVEIAASAPCEFDEIALMPSGVQLSALSNVRLRYAFVGDLIKHTITETSMQNYANEHGRMPFSLDQGAQQREGRPNGIETGYWIGSDLINDDLTDGVLWGVIAIGSQMEARVGAAMNRQDPDQSQPFKAGSTVGFVYGNGSILNLPIGDAVRIRLYEGHWVQQHSAVYGDYYEYQQTEVQDESVKINVLSVNLVKGGNYEVTITANHDFSHARISFPTGLTLNLGGNKVKYAFICDPPTYEHKCDLRLSADVALCTDDTEYQLSTDSDIPVTWSLVDQPAGANASVDQNGRLTGITVEGVYQVRATAPDGCSEDVFVTSGLNFDTRCDMPISNDDDENFALSDQIHDVEFDLININDYLINKENVLNTNYNDYATFNSTLDLTLVENKPLVGVKKTDGTKFSGNGKRRVGFVIETKSTVLSADVIDIFHIRTYNNGTRTYSSPITETNAVKAKVIGSNKMQKMRYSIIVPENVQFDEFVLWKSGVLDVQLDKFKVYYAFDEEVLDTDTLSDCADPLGCKGQVVSIDDNVTLNNNEIQFAGAINAANVVRNLSYLVDNDLNTAVSVSNTISAGNGLVFAIDLGRVYSPKHQVGIVIDNKTYLAEAKVGNWLTIETYLNGVKTGDKQSDWSVLGVNAIGYGDKSFLYLNPTLPYDEVRITIAAIVNALDFDTKYFGIFVRSDYDGDGSPDCQDDYTCPNPLSVDIRYESQFDAINEENIYKNHVKIFNNDGYPVMIEQMPVGSVIEVYRLGFENPVANIEVTDVEQLEDGTYKVYYTNTPGAYQYHVDVERYPDAQGFFTADEWGYIDFIGLFITDQYTAPTANNTHATEYHYMARLVNEQRSRRTESAILDVPVLKTGHQVNAATYTNEEVTSDTDHHLELVHPVDVYVQMKNDANNLRYSALRYENDNVDTVAWAQRVDDLTFNRQIVDNSNVQYDWGSVIFPAEGSVQTVVLRDSTLQGLAEYVPIIHAYTNSFVNKHDTIVVSTYGANRITDVLPIVTLTAQGIEKSKDPFNGYMGYAARLLVNAQIPNDQEPYLYRIWRVLPDGSEVLLNNLTDTIVYTDETHTTVLWATDYSALHDEIPVNNFEVVDRFVYKALAEHETMDVRYRVRLYTLQEAITLGIRSNRNGAGDYGLAESNDPAEFDDNTPTGLMELEYANDIDSVTYYNPLGMSSSRPFDGINVVLIRYRNGKTIIEKHMY